MNWSHSRLRTFRECPLRYKLLYLDGYAGEPVPAFEAGSALHAMVHEYGEWCYAHKVDEDEAQARVIASTSADPQVQHQFLWFTRNHTWEFEGLLGKTDDLFETWHTLDLGDEDVFRCRIDLCRWADREVGELEITDWKSGGWSYPLPPEECPIQLRLYALVVACELGEQVYEVHARYLYLGSGVAWDFHLGEDDWRETEEWLRAQIARVKREEAFRAEPPGSYCGNCSCRSACTVGYQTPVDVLTTEAVIRELDVLNAKREALSDSLKQRVTNTGPYTDERGRTWAYHEGEECFDVPDPVKYAAARREAKLKPWAFVSFNQNALRRDANRQPLRDLLEEKPRERRFGAKTEKPEEADQ